MQSASIDLLLVWYFGVYTLPMHNNWVVQMTTPARFVTQQCHCCSHMIFLSWGRTTSMTWRTMTSRWCPLTLTRSIVGQAVAVTGNMRPCTRRTTVIAPSVVGPQTSRTRTGGGKIIFIFYLKKLHVFTAAIFHFKDRLTINFVSIS